MWLDSRLSRVSGLRSRCHVGWALIWWFWGKNSLSRPFTSLVEFYFLPPYVWSFISFPCSSVGKESACNAGDPGSIPGSGSSPGEGNGNPLQYSCLENRMDRGAWRATAQGLAKSRTRLSDLHIACQPPVTLPLALTCILHHIPSSTCKASIKLF